MTNLQDNAARSRQRLHQRLLLFVPTGLGGVLALAVTAAFTVPQWLRLQSNAAQVRQLEELQQRVPLLRAQLTSISTNQERAQARQQQLLTLIQGSGEFSTFLAQLDREASRHGVQLELFEPVAAAPAPEVEAAKPGKAKDKQDDSAAAAPTQEPLAVAGLRAERVLLSARGDYPNLLQFIRAVEQLSLLVVPSNFSLGLAKVPAPARSSAGTTTAPDTDITMPELKLALAYFRGPGRGSQAPGQVAPPADPAKAPAANPQPAS